MLLKAVFREMFGSVNITAQKSNWLKLKDIGEVVGGATPKTTESKFWNGPYKWITPAEIFQDSYWISNTERTLTEEGINSCLLKVLPPNTVLLTSRAPIGKTALTACNMYCNQGFKNIICSEKINPEYLNYILHNNSDYLNSLGRGATFKEISKSIVENIKVPVPVVKKQRQFVSYIHQKQKVEATLQLMLEKLELLKKIAFKKIYDSADKIKILGEICDVRDGTHNSPKYVLSSEYPLITSKNITSGRIDFSTANYISKKDFDEINKRSEVSFGDILMPMIGTVGKPLIVETHQKFAIKNVALLRTSICKNVKAIYLKAYFESNYFSQQKAQFCKGGTQKFLSLGDIRSLQIKIPSMANQETFKKYIDHIDKMKNTLQKELSNLTGES